MGWAVGEHKIVFYADNGRIKGRNHIWVQTKLTEVLQIFDRVGLLTNIGKIKTMVRTLGFVWVQNGTLA